MILTKEELAFLARMGLSATQVFDGLGLASRQWKLLVEMDGRPIALGNSCTNGKHRLKWPSGHCAQCNPQIKGFRDRYSQTKYIYIAGSLSHKVVKIGIGDDPKQRLSILRRLCDALWTTPGGDCGS